MIRQFLREMGPMVAAACLGVGLGIWIDNHNREAELEDARDQGFRAAVKSYRRNQRQDSMAAIVNDLVFTTTQAELDWTEDDSIFVNIHDGTSWKCVVCSKIDTADTMPAVESREWDSLKALGEVHPSMIYRASGIWIESSDGYRRKRRVDTCEHLSDVEPSPPDGE